ncbi:MAG: preprotein translocase subunit YajC [Pseudomonadota bacterium]
MISNLYAMAQSPAAPGQQPSALQTFLLPMLFVFVIFYFILIRPQRKREQKQKQFLESLKKGDEVITQSGIYGRIGGIDGLVVTLQIADNVRIRVGKASIAGLQLPQTGSDGKK